MSQTYTIKSVNSQRDGSFTTKDGDHVALTDYELVVNNGQRDGTVWLSQKPETAPPQVGQSITGETMPIPGGPLKGQLKLKKEQPNNFRPSGGPAPNDPERQKSIERQVAAKCAAEMLTSGDGFEALATRVYDWIQGNAPADPTADLHAKPADDDIPF